MPRPRSQPAPSKPNPSPARAAAPRIKRTQEKPPSRASLSSSNSAPWPTPATPDQLHAWIRENLGITIVRQPLFPTSSAPFDYLCAAFFESRVPSAHPEVSSPPVASSPDRLSPSPQDLLLWANRGGGKTFLGALATLLDLIFKPGIEVRILGGSLEQSRRMLEHLRRFAERDAIAPLIDGRLTDKRLKLTNGSRAEVLAQSHTSVRGTRVQKIRCDEVDLFDREVWEAAQLTTRSMPCKGPWGETVGGTVEALSTLHRPMGLMWDLVASASRSPSLREGTGGRVLPLPESTNMAYGPECGYSPSDPLTASPSRPPSPPPRLLFRWGITDALEHCPPARDCRVCELEPDCQGRAKLRLPAAAGHVAIADALAMKQRVSRAAWESEMLCLRPKRSDCVYPEFDLGSHVFSSMPAAHQSSLTTQLFLAGMDFGLRSPTVILWASLDDDGILRITHEYAQTDRTLDQHIAELQRDGRPTPKWIGVDPAGHSRNDQTGRSNITALRHAGLIIRARRAGLHEGIAAVRARLQPATGGPRLFIHQRCKRLIESLVRYHYPEDRPESLEPVKNGHDHAADALRYLIINLDRESTARRGNYLGSR
ncbi:MAG: hypothetical protein ACREJO_17625 [Phycisphaerales bacterium]